MGGAELVNDERPGYEQPPPAPTRRRASLVQTAKAVLWSFFGVRKKASYEHDAANLNPLHVIIMGVVAAALFVLALLAIIRFVVLA